MKNNLMNSLGSKHLSKNYMKSMAWKLVPVPF